MTTTIAEILQSNSDGDVARLSRLASCLDDTGPMVVWLHGRAGSGKSDLLRRFLTDSEHIDATVLQIDCGAFEPTPAGFIEAISDALGRQLEDLAAASTAVTGAGMRVIVALDNYEVFRLIDTWLRREFVPSLGTNCRFVFTSREPPTAGWLGSSTWSQHFISVAMDDGETSEIAVDELLDSIQDREARRALEPLSVIRRITLPLMDALCPEYSNEGLFEEIARLSFVERRRDGLAINNAVQRELADRLRASDPSRFRHYQRQAWQLLHRQLKSASRADLWRYSADIIYLIENPVIREAFFPSQSARYSVEPAGADDEAAIMEIIERHEPSTAQLTLWWQHLPGSFHVVRDARNRIAGFYCAAMPHELRSDWMQKDPVARAWQSHLFGSGGDLPSLFLRRWLSREEGESPCAAQAAAWVDIKRSYLELRPELHRVYLDLLDLTPYAAVATELGFQVLEDLTVDCGGRQCFTAMLEFGPGSVDGWISRLVATELGVSESQLVDPRSRELVLQDERISLTKLEFGVASLLETHRGEAVSRETLLQQVWGRNFDGSSNVVDSVVKGLRKKCGDHAEMFETVRGVGYRLNA